MAGKTKRSPKARARSTGGRAAAKAKKTSKPAKPAAPPPAKKGTVKRPAAATGASSSSDLPPADAADGHRGAQRSTATPHPAQSGKYVYCVIPTRQTHRFGPIGIGAQPSDVHTINYQDVAAVVSDTPIEVYDPTRENVLAHERVNETVMRQFTVIPMSFGTVFKTREDIVELLRSAYEAFRDVLQKMEGKIELGLKVLWDPEQIIREIEQSDENVRRLKEEIGSQKGSTYFARMQYGRLVDALLQERSEQYKTEIFEGLRDVCVASRANKPIGDKMILNGAFLVAREKETHFDAKVKAIDARYEKLTFKYTGPWPPYNFVNIRLKLERAQGNE